MEAGLAPKSEGRQSGGWTTGDSAATIKVTTRSETVSALVAPVVSTTSVTERSASVRAAGSVTQMSAPVPVAVAPSTDNSTYIDQIIADLKARGLIQSEDHLSFRLDIHELKVNGVREPDEIYQAFKAKYFNNSKNFFRYNHNGGSVSSETGFITGESLSAYENKD